MAAALVFGTVAPSFDLLMTSRILAGVFAGGLIPLVLAGMGDRYDMQERQVMIGRLLFAIITGQMLGSLVAGITNAAYGWRSAVLVSAAASVLATALAWFAIPRPPRATPPPGGEHPSFRVLYGRVFENPKAIWLYAAVVAEGVFIFGLFPYVGPLLIERTGSDAEAAARQAGFVLGAFGIGGLAYAFSVRRIIDALGVRRMCWIGATGAALCYAALALLRLWWLDALVMVVIGLGYYMLHNSLQAEATEIAPAARGSAVALFAAGLFAGQGLGPLLFGGLVHTLGFEIALLACCIGLLLLGRLVVRKVIG
jgi:predicted MFS family arabinose efflux permease